jgi:ferric-dicitrate binding protein FerR (iron transport regulator)
MNSDEQRPTGATSPEPELVADLIRSAGRRAAPPETAYRQALDAATNAWRLKIDRMQRRRRYLQIATGLAAGMATLALLFAILPRDERAPAARVAALERIIGTLEVRPTADAGWQLLHDDSAVLHAGTRLRTGASSRAGLRLEGGASLRLAEGTEVVLADPAKLELIAGRAYVDSGSGPRAGKAIEIVTPTATAIEVGTQFEVGLFDDTYRLRVREGRVVLRHGDGHSEGAAGEQLLIGPDGRIERTAILTTDVDWQWVESVAPAPDVNERPVTDLLAWVARETGRPVRFTDGEVERRAATTILHGSIRHLAPLEALSVMLATTDLEYVELGDGTLLIRTRPTH